MNQSATKKTSKMVIVLNKIKTYFSKPQNIILLLFGIVLSFTTVAPIVAIVEDTFKIHPGTIDAHLTGKASGYSVANYVDLFTSKLARTNLWTPLLNTVLLAVFTCLISINGESAYTCRLSFVQTMIQNMKRFSTDEEFVTSWS